MECSYASPNNCTCVSEWTGCDCLTGMSIYTILNSLYRLIKTQQYVLHHVALINNVQVPTIVHVSVDGQAVIV